MSKIRPGPAFFFTVLFFLLPAPARPQNSGDGPAEIKRLFESRGFSVEEGLLFSGGEVREETPESGEAGAPSLLIPFPGTAGTRAESGGSGIKLPELPPLMIAAFPLDGAYETPAAGLPEGGLPDGEAPENRLPYPLQAALSLAGQRREGQAAGQRFPGDLLIAFLGKDDIRQYEDRRSRIAGELAAYGGMIGAPENAFFWYFDLPEPPQSLVIHHGTSRTIAPLDALEGLPELFRSLGLRYSFAVPFNEMYKLGLAGGPEILRFTQEQDIRALFFSGAGVLAAGDPGRISAAALAELILAYAGSRESPGENPDYHYLIIPLGRSHIFLSQEHTALLLLLFAAVFFLSLLLYLGFFRPPMARIRLFFRCFWVIPVFSLLLFVSLEGAGLITGLLSRGRDHSVALVYGWSAWKLILGLGFFALISIPLGNYRISRRPAFYGSGALLVIILDIFITAWVDISFIPFFIAAFVLIFFGAQIKRPLPVYLCALSAPFYGFIAGFFSIRSGYGGLGEILLSNDPYAAVFMILAFLPFVLLFKRGISLGRRGKPVLIRRLVPFFVLMGLGVMLVPLLIIAS
ncbi:MAG: hypothetical protein LBK27_03030 [Treponema sp.]|nr:hypothetical protein [Treponema sp.]